MEPSYLDRGREQACQGDYQGAIATFSQAIQLNPHLADAYYRRGLAYLKLGSLHEAVFDYTAALNCDRDRMEFYYARAFVRVQLKNLHGALTDVQAAISRNFNYAPAHQLKGTIEEKLTMLPASVASFKQAANLYLAAKDSDNCRICLQKIEKLQFSVLKAPELPPPAPPKLLSQPQLLAQILQQAEKGDCTGALQALDWAIKVDDKDAQVYCCRGIVKSKMGDRQGASNDLNQALRIDPQEAMNYVGRGEVCSAMGNYQDAIIDFSQALNLKPDYPEAYLSRAQAYTHQEEMQKAISDRQIAASQFSAKQDWHNYHKTLAQLRQFQSGGFPGSVSSSTNFAFLQTYEPKLANLATLAEQYYTKDPVTCLMKLRQFGELLAQCIAKKVQLSLIPNEPQLDLLNRLHNTGYLPDDRYRMFQEIRRVGNQAAHDYTGEHRTALKHLKYAREIAIWYCRSFGGDTFFAPDPFIAPPES